MLLQVDLAMFPTATPICNLSRMSNTHQPEIWTTSTASTFAMVEVPLSTRIKHSKMNKTKAKNKTTTIFTVQEKKSTSTEKQIFFSSQCPFI